MRRIIQINLFIVIEAIYYITHSLVHFIFRLRSCPEQNISVGSPHRFQFFHFTRSLFIDKRRSRNQSWIFVVDICQNLTIVAFIFYHCSSIPLTASLYGWKHTLQVIFGKHLVLSRIFQIWLCYSTNYVLSDKQWTCGRMTRPPADQFIIICCRMTDFPIDLRDIIIYPAIVDPKQYIGIQVIVILKSVCIASIRI